MTRNGPYIYIATGGIVAPIARRLCLLNSKRASASSQPYVRNNVFSHSSYLSSHRRHSSCRWFGMGISVHGKRLSSRKSDPDLGSRHERERLSWRASYLCVGDLRQVSVLVVYIHTWTSR